MEDMGVAEENGRNSGTTASVHPNIRENFWKGKRVMVTGHTGFKGSWLCIWLLEMGAEVTGYALPPYTPKDNYAVCGMERRLTDIRGDILDEKGLEEAFQKYQPEILFHLAAQPLVRRSYQEPKLTYETNVIGSLNVLEAARKTGSVKSAVMVTTDKCYENREMMRGYREEDPMGGYDPYSSSKGCMELLIASYRNSFLRDSAGKGGQMEIASARAGNVIGGGDWQEDRLIPDCMRAIERGKPVQIRNPGAIRPWQFVLEPLGGYLLLAERLWEEPEQYSEGWNFGPETEQTATVGEVVEEMLRVYGEGTFEYRGEKEAPHEAGILLLDISKAKRRLGWKPRLNLEETLAWTAEWYRDYQKKSPYEICRKQIREFMRRES